MNTPNPSPHFRRVVNRSLCETDLGPRTDPELMYQSIGVVCHVRTDPDLVCQSK